MLASFKVIDRIKNKLEESLNTNQSNLENKTSKFVKNLNEKDKHIHLLQAQINKFKEKSQNESHELTEYKSKIENLQKEYNKKLLELDTINTEKSSKLEVELKGYEIKYKKLWSKFEGLDAERNRFCAENKNLNEEIEEIKKENEFMKNQVKELNRKNESKLLLSPISNDCNSIYETKIDFSDTKKAPNFYGYFNKPKYMYSVPVSYTSSPQMGEDEEMTFRSIKTKLNDEKISLKQELEERIRSSKFNRIGNMSPRPIQSQQSNFTYQEISSRITSLEEKINISAEKLKAKHNFLL